MPPPRTFRVPYWRVYLPAAVYTQVFLTAWLWGCFAISLLAGYPHGAELAGFIALAHLFYSLSVPVTLLPIGVLVYWWVVAVRVSAGGLTCPNTFGWRTTVSWETVVAVKRSYLLGFPHLLLRCERRWLRLRLPLTLERLGEFLREVELFAGPRHVLTQSLRAVAEEH